MLQPRVSKSLIVLMKIHVLVKEKGSFDGSPKHAIDLKIL